MTLTIKTKNKDALKILGGQLKDTGFEVIHESETEISIPHIGRKSHNYIKKVVKNLSIETVKAIKIIHNAQVALIFYCAIA